jgi:aspartate/methionine/tyrosine aminotransferase
MARASALSRRSLPLDARNTPYAIGVVLVTRIADAAASRLLGIEHSETAIDLSVGEPDFPTPEGVRAAGIRAIEADKTRYTPRLGLPELREAVRARLAREKAYEPAYEDTIVTAGGSPAICIAIAASCGRGDTILVPEPSWPNYDMFAAQLGVASRRYRQRPSSSLDLDEIDGLVYETTKLIVVNSPSNPTGAVVGRDDVERLVELAQRRGIWILSDEAYESIVYDGLQAWSPSALGGAEQTFAAYTFSKTYAMTGWRVGYLVVPARFRRAALELQATITGCAPAMAQHAAVYALEHAGSAAEAMRLAYSRRRDLAIQALDGAGVIDRIPEGAFYLWLDIGRTRRGGLEFTNLLAQNADVVVSAGEVYSSQSNHHVRVSFAVDDQHLLAALERIRATVERLAADSDLERHEAASAQ